ncbi:YkoF-like protein [Xylaria sp. FL1777]|nr:YkoF-like protein [Xylaria sp. FL1777]
MEYAHVATPERCYADFCLIPVRFSLSTSQYLLLLSVIATAARPVKFFKPVGTGSVSVAEEVAEVQKLLKASGLVYTMHSAGTTVEGSWDEVMRVIGQAHSVVHARGVVRVQSSMRVGTRTDKKQTAQDKVKRVEDILSKSAS